MLRLERFVYDLVKGNPRLKRNVRNAYQMICDLVPVKRFHSAYEIHVRPGFFFGFHDVTPWSPDNTMMLAHRFSIPLRMPLAHDEVEVGFFSGDEFKNFTVVGRTLAWNWHQGAMLQWMGPSEQIVFNDFDGRKHVARIVDTEGCMLSTLPLPVAAISPDGQLAISHNFARLRGTPHGYAYANGADFEQDQLAPEADGIHIMDVASGSSQLLFSVKEIASIAPDTTMRGAFQYFSHCQFSPSGQRFSFFHRWVQRSNEIWTRMISCAIDGSDLHIFRTAGMVSHIDWRDDSHILAYARTRPLGDGYYLFEDLSDVSSAIGRKHLTSDGHPSFSHDRRWILTDTYADRLRLRSLVLYDTHENRRFDLLRLFSPKEFSGVSIADHLQCDFHPRWNRDSTMISFDSAHTGTRALCFITVGDLDITGPTAV